MENTLIYRILALISIIMGTFPYQTISAADNENSRNAYPDELILSIKPSNYPDLEGEQYQIPRVDKELNIYKFKGAGIVTATTVQEIEISSPETGIMTGNGEPILLDEDSPISFNGDGGTLRLQEDWTGVMWIKLNDDGTGILLFSNDKDFVPDWASKFRFILPDELIIMTYTMYLPYKNEDEAEYMMPRVDIEQNIYKFTCDKNESIRPEQAIHITSRWIDCIGGNGLPFTFEKEYKVTAFTNSLPISLQEEWNGVLWLKMDDICHGTIVFSNNRDFVPEWASHLNDIKTVNDEKDSTLRYFDMKGIEHFAPDKGVYIRVSGDKTEKVVF